MRKTIAALRLPHRLRLALTAVGIAVGITVGAAGAVPTPALAQQTYHCYAGGIAFDVYAQTEAYYDSTGAKRVRVWRIYGVQPQNNFIPWEWHFIMRSDNGLVWDGNYQTDGTPRYYAVQDPPSSANQKMSARPYVDAYVGKLGDGYATCMVHMVLEWTA